MKGERASLVTYTVLYFRLHRRRDNPIVRKGFVGTSN